MDDDLNTAKALAVLFSLVNKLKKAEFSNYINGEKHSAKASLVQKTANTIIMLGEVLGFNFSLKDKQKLNLEDLQAKILPLYEEFGYDDSINPKTLLNKLLEDRNHARTDKDWAKSDLIRDKLLGSALL